MSESQSKRLSKIQKIIEFGLSHSEFTPTDISKELKIANKYIKEYIEIIDFISKNPVEVTTINIKKNTYYKFKDLRR